MKVTGHPVGRILRSPIAIAAIVMLVCSMTLSAAPVRAADDPQTYKGTLPGTAIEYVFEVPANWNGTLFLYSHGISYGPLYAAVSGDQFTRNWLLAQGYALAGGSYANAGYEPGLQYPAQLRVLDAFDGITGRHPERTIAWGHSGGGQITADLARFAPDRFAGAVAMCPFRLGGGIGNFNERLDHMFVLKTLLGFSAPLVNIGFGFGQLAAYENEEIALLQSAQQTPAGRARFAFAEAMVGTPDWSDDPLASRPAPTDYTTRANNEFARALADTYADKERGYYEHQIAVDRGYYDTSTGALHGVSFSWNTGVDYAALLAQSSSADLVEALYRQAGLDLKSDLALLKRAPRIAADPGAVVRMEAIQPIFGDGPRIPVVTLYAAGDPYVYIDESQGYQQAAQDAGAQGNLRQLYLPVGGHCEYTGAEQVATIQTLLTRVASGVWPSTDPTTLNAQASAMGADANKFVGLSSLNGIHHDPRFAALIPPTFLRSFDAATVNPYP